MRQLQPVNDTQHGGKHHFTFKELHAADRVFVRCDLSKRCLQMPYDGPYQVINRSSKTFVVNINRKHTTVTIDRLKPAYTMSDEPQGQLDTPNSTSAQGQGTNTRESQGQPTQPNKKSIFAIQTHLRAGIDTNIKD
ncbi:hypothetical protein M8J75_000918 [Diaphorina citri]|nr:hypothetical protein M8J75_000918 [Diaphorina citri]